MVSGWWQNSRQYFLSKNDFVTRISQSNIEDITDFESLNNLKEKKHTKVSRDPNYDDIADNDALFGDEGLGLDSVDAIELVLAVEKEYGVKIKDSKLYETIFASVQSLLFYINANKK